MVQVSNICPEPLTRRPIEWIGRAPSFDKFSSRYASPICSIKIWAGDPNQSPVNNLNQRETDAVKLIPAVMALICLSSQQAMPHLLDERALE